MSIGSRIQRRLGNRMRESLTFLVATAWVTLFNDIFVMIAGDSTHIFMRLVHAIAFTILAVFVTILLEGYETTDDHED